MIEQAVSLEQLNATLQKNEARLTKAQNIVDGIELVGFSQAEPLRLDVEDVVPREERHVLADGGGKASLVLLGAGDGRLRGQRRAVGRTDGDECRCADG